MMTTNKPFLQWPVRSILINRLMYGFFIAVAMYFLFIKRDIGMAMSDLGFALIFDPFDTRVGWNERPVYQRLWLIAHLLLMFVLLGLTLLN